MSQQRYVMMRDRKLGLNPVYWNAISQTSPATRLLYGTAVTREWIVQHDGRSRSTFLKREWDRVAEYIASRLFHSAAFFRMLQARIEKAKREAFAAYPRLRRFDPVHTTFGELLTTARAIQRLWLSYDDPNVSAWFIGGDRLKQRVGEALKLAPDDLDVLTTPVEGTIISRLEPDVLKAGLRVRRSPKLLSTLARRLANAYGWVPFGYEGPTYWDERHFAREVRKSSRWPAAKLRARLVEHRRAVTERTLRIRRALARHRFSSAERALINRVTELARWTDERKRVQFELHYHYARILHELGRRFGVPLVLMRYLLLEELSGLRGDAAALRARAKDRLSRPLVLFCRNGQVRILPRSATAALVKALDSEQRVGELSGIVACRGPRNRYRANVKVLETSAEARKVKAGDFLVASMTTPDFIVAMRKAAGFITDEGGVTCHAAIVAREMNKPCIIGTKIATRALKDGDRVEVDATKGIVRKL